MKKLLLIAFMALIGGNILPTMPKQNIFTDTYAYRCEEINTGKLAIAESILSPKCESLILVGRKEAFYNDLVGLYKHNKLTQESLLATIERHQKINKHQLTSIASVHETHVGELLKEQKNHLIRKNHKLVMDHNNGNYYE